MNEVQTEISIVGAGPAGALLAFLLVKKGFDVTLIESSGQLGRAFRGEHLNEHGELLLKRYNLFENLQQKGILPMTRLENWQDGQPFNYLTPDKEIGHFGIHVPQRFLLQTILEPIEHAPNFHLYLNTRVTNVQDKGIVARNADGQLHIQSKLIVGADGRNSVVRKKAGFVSKTWEHGYDLLWARIDRPIGWEPVIATALFENHQVALFTQAENRIQLGININKGSFIALKKQSFQAFLEKIIALFPVLEPQFRSGIKSWRDFVLLDVYSSYAETWGKDGVVLIGDAAHTMTPTGAYGLNSALIDAEYFANFIEEDATISNEAIDAFERQRSARIHQLQQQQRIEEKNFGIPFIRHALESR